MGGGVHFRTSSDQGQKSEKHHDGLVWICKKLLSMFGMAKCKCIITPRDVSANFSKGQHLGSMEEECEMVNVPYKVTIASLMYRSATKGSGGL